jgi:hypothetical protein
MALFCTICGNGGLVSVPHQEFVKLDASGNKEFVPIRKNRFGEPVYVYENVTCVCERGIAMHENLSSGDGVGSKAKTPLSLETYKRWILGNPEQVVATIEYERRLRRGTLLPTGDLFTKADVDKALSSVGTIPL